MWSFAHGKAQNASINKSLCFAGCSVCISRNNIPFLIMGSANCPKAFKPIAMKPIVQISLDLTNIDEALETAAMALRAGVDWLEAGTPLILAEGLHGVKKLRQGFPGIPIVADLKTMDGGYLEAEMMAKAGATHVVVMARAHEETIKCVVKAGHD